MVYVRIWVYTFYSQIERTVGLVFGLLFVVHISCDGAVKECHNEMTPNLIVCKFLNYFLCDSFRNLNGYFCTLRQILVLVA
jgi:hypothetical protein